MIVADCREFFVIFAVVNLLLNLNFIAYEKEKMQNFREISL